MLRIAQEAIGNAVRHGAPTQIGVIVEYQRDGFAVDVTDDGHGFKPSDNDAELIRNEHWGMGGMHDRARAATVEHNIDSTPGVGTSVEARYEPGAHGKAEERIGQVDA